MGQTLTNGIFLPNEGERNCYTGLEGNWRAIDGYIGGYNVHVEDVVIHVSQADRDKWDAVDNKADTTALTAHTGDTTIHVTAADKEAWNGKADSSALTAHTGNTTIHVTAEDKAKWDAVTTKANDASVMHLTGDETSTGKKVFGDMATFDGSYLGNETSANARTDLVLESNRDTHGQSGIYITKFRQNKAQGSMSGNDVVYIALDVLENSVRTNQALRASFTQFVNDIPTRVIFYSDVNGARFLGTAANKWTHINGLNPGALSLPNLDAGVDISAYITDITGTSNINKFTPTADGWVSIGLSNADFIEIYIPSSLIGGSFTKSSVNNYGQAFMPVIANKEVRFALKGSSIGWAKFYPCQGNV